MEKTSVDVPTNGRAPTSQIRMLALMVLCCERLIGDPSSETQIREQAARLYDQWIGLVRNDRWFSEAVSPLHLSSEGETLIERMESFLDALVDRLRRTGGAGLQRSGKDAKRLEGRLVGRAVAFIEKKGRRALLAMATRIGGK